MSTGLKLLTALFTLSMASLGMAQSGPITIVLAQHGIPANDCPKEIMKEFEELIVPVHYRHTGTPEQVKRFHELEEIIVHQPRNLLNDPFWDSSYHIAKVLKDRTQYPIFVGFNEYCNPTLPDALELAAKTSTDRVVVVTPMMTPGGGHPERDIPSAIEPIEKKYPQLEILYAWPKTAEEIEAWIDRSADVIAKQIRKFSKNGENSPVVLVQHGVMVDGYKRQQLKNLIELCSQPSPECDHESQTYFELAKRNKYWMSSKKMAQSVSQKLNGRQVEFSFNEFAYPTVDQVLKTTAQGTNSKNVLVITSMLTNGGDHGEIDIPAAIERVGSTKNKNGIKTTFNYAWPYDNNDVADYLQTLIEEQLAK